MLLVLSCKLEWQMIVQDVPPWWSTGHMLFMQQEGYLLHPRFMGCWCLSISCEMMYSSLFFVNVWYVFFLPQQRIIISLSTAQGMFVCGFVWMTDFESCALKKFFKLGIPHFPMLCTPGYAIRTWLKPEHSRCDEYCIA